MNHVLYSHKLQAELISFSGNIDLWNFNTKRKQKILADAKIT